MKVQLIGRSKKIPFRAQRQINRGFATLEILIAFTVIILCMSAVIMVVSSNQSMVIDNEINNEAISKAQALLEKTRAQARQDFSSVNNYTVVETSGSLTYNKDLIVTDLTACKKQVVSKISWTTGLRVLTTTLSTFFADVAGVLALGGDCITDSPISGWTNPQRFASDTFNPGKPTTIDVLNKIAYLGSDKIPFLYIADTHGAVLGQNSNLFVTFTNGFNLGATPNAIDVARLIDPVSGNQKNYAFLAMDTNTNQLKVVDVTDIKKPVLIATRSLSVCVAGAAPQGWRLYVYKNRLYFLTRFTAGPEFHVFDISDPNNPTEIGNGVCKGFELGDTAESIEVRDKDISGTMMRFVYLATDEIDKELRVLNATNPLLITNVAAANQNLPGAQDGQSVYIVGDKLYFGRQSTPGGPDLYVYNINNPPAGLTLLGSQDIGTGVLGIRVVGLFGFLATSKVNKEFQVWNIAVPSSINLIKEYNFGNIVSNGIDYEPDFIYATGQSTPNFQIIYSP